MITGVPWPAPPVPVRALLKENSPLGEGERCGWQRLRRRFPKKHRPRERCRSYSFCWIFVFVFGCGFRNFENTHRSNIDIVTSPKGQRLYLGNPWFGLYCDYNVSTDKQQLGIRPECGMVWRGDVGIL